MILSILLAILVFGILIFVHELGHFAVAKMSGIVVLQFNIGFGPVLLKKQWGETQYAIRAIPLGGAVMMKGADEEEELLVGKPQMPGGDGEYNARLDPASEVGSFFAASKLQRFAVCAAGPLMNIIFGILVLFFVFAPAVAIPIPVITGFGEGFALEGELMRGDEVVRINDFHIFTYNDLLTALTLGEGGTYDITVRRADGTVKLKDLPLTRSIYDAATDSYRFGINFTEKPVDWLGRLDYSMDTAMSFMQSTVISLKMLFTGLASPKEMMGTVGITSEISSRAQQSMREMWAFVSFISINLAFVNLLPIPAVDGGKILFIGIEAVRGKRMNPKVEGYFSLAGLAFILGLFIFVNFNDVLRLIG